MSLSIWQVAPCEVETEDTCPLGIRIDELRVWEDKLLSSISRLERTAVPQSPAYVRDRFDIIRVVRVDHFGQVPVVLQNIVRNRIDSAI